MRGMGRCAMFWMSNARAVWGRFGVVGVGVGIGVGDASGREDEFEGAGELAVQIETRDAA